MKKTIFEKSMIILMTAVICTFTLFITSMFGAGKTSNMYYNKFLTQDVKQVTLSSTNEVDSNYKLNYMNLSDNYSLYKNVRETNNQELDSIRAVYSVGDNAMPEIIKGRYFTNEDFENGTPVAVVGEIAAERSVKIIDDKEIYSYLGIDYEVIGHMGFGKRTDIDSMILLNLSAFVKNAPLVGIYYIDGKNLNDIIQARNNFAMQFDELVIKNGMKVIYTEYENNIESLNSNSKYILILSFGMIILNLLIINCQYINKKSYTIAVKKLCGASKSELTFDFILPFFIMTSIGFFIGANLFNFLLLDLVQTILGNILLKINFLSLISAYLITLIIAIGTLYPYLTHIYNIDISICTKQAHE